MDIEKAKKYLLLTIILGWFSSGYSIGEIYLGSFWGDIIFISSGLFLLVFSILNVLKGKEIENKTIDTSKIKYIDILIVSYFIIYVALYIVRSFKPPSSFLICLFFIYLALTIIWIFVFDNKTISKTSFLLLLLALLPLVTGLIFIGEENSIKNSIETLSSSKVYYEDNLDNITNGILTSNVASDIRYNIQLLESDLDDAEKDYLSGDLTGSGNKIEHAKEIDIKLKEYFSLLDPQRAIFDMLRIRDKTIDRLYSTVRNIAVYSNNSSCEQFELEQIKIDINLTKTKLNESWSEYRAGDFQLSYNIIKNTDRDLTNIERQIQRCDLQVNNLLIGAIITGLGVLFIYIITSKYWDKINDIINRLR